MSDKRIIEQTASSDVYGDDWFVKESSRYGTTKISKADFIRVMREGFEGIIELTQAEYDALPSSKESDGILYAIKDSTDIIALLNGNICSVNWSTTGTYVKGDYVIHENIVYKCTANTATVGTFVPGEWTQTDVIDIAGSVEDLAEEAVETANEAVETAEEALGEIDDAIDEINSFKDAVEIKGTASGTIATFTDGSDLPMLSCVANIEAVQSGSGDPSPTNIRPISGWAGCNLTVADAQTSPTVSNVYNVKWSSQGTIYGGYVDLCSGVLTVTHTSIDLGTLTWIARSAQSDFRMRAQVTPIHKIIENDAILSGKCETYALISAYETYTKVMGLSGDNTGNYIFVYDENYNTSESASAFKTAMDGVQLVYELATPTTYQLSAQQVKSLLGANNIFADCGSMKNVTYVRDATTIINYILSRLN